MGPGTRGTCPPQRMWVLQVARHHTETSLAEAQWCLKAIWDGQRRPESATLRQLVHGAAKQFIAPHLAAESPLSPTHPREQGASRVVR